MGTLTHYRKLANPDYLGAYDFAQGEERIVTIKEIKREMITGDGGKKEECTVCHFVENYKPMILNATNQKAIARLAETPYIEQWTGKSFKLIVVKVKAFGDVVDALRIKSEKIVKPILIIGTPNFDACAKAYKSGTTLEAIKGKYEVSAETEEALNK